MIKFLKRLFAIRSHKLELRFNNKDRVKSEYEKEIEASMKKIFACPNFKRMLEIEKLKSLAMFGVVDGMGRVCSHEIGGIGLMTHKGVCAVCKSYIRRKG